MKAPTREQLRHLGSLITYLNGGVEQCLGFIMCFEGRGCFDPTFGKLDITPDEADKHNEALSTALIEGMDNQCKVGQGNLAYYNGKTVTTFIGTEIAPSSDITRKRNVIEFTRKGRLFRGKISPDSECFTFTRIA